MEQSSGSYSNSWGNPFTIPVNDWENLQSRLDAAREKSTYGGRGSQLLSEVTKKILCETKVNFQYADINLLFSNLLGLLYNKQKAENFPAFRDLLLTYKDIFQRQIQILDSDPIFSGVFDRSLLPMTSTSTAEIKSPKSILEIQAEKKPYLYLTGLLELDDTEKLQRRDELSVFKELSNALAPCADEIYNHFSKDLFNEKFKSNWHISEIKSEMLLKWAFKNEKMPELFKEMSEFRGLLNLCNKIKSFNNLSMTTQEKIAYTALNKTCFPDIK